MDKINEKLSELINMPPKDVDINEAAMLLLQLNRNRILYQNLVRRNDVPKCLYELRKYYDNRVARGLIKKSGISTQKQEDNVNVSKSSELDENVKKGMREDHDSLPDVVKGYYLENLNIHPLRRKLHEQLKLMVNATPEERKPLLEELSELDKRHSANWELYDNYDPQKGLEQIEDPAELAKKISASRKYLSTNKDKIETLEGEARDVLLAKMQERFDLLVQNDAGVSDEQREEYRKIGLNV